MKNTLTLLKDFCTFDFIERNWEKAPPLLTKDICWFGTSDQEDVHSIEDVKNYLQKEIGSMPNPYQMKITEEYYIPIGSSGGVAFIRMTMENDGVKLATRVTAASRLENGQEKLCSMHFSVSDSTQQPDEYFPIAIHKQKIAKAKNELVLSTMPGGLLGGYIQTDFPFYFINEGMLEYLGYANESEFLTDIDGFIINGIHPDDRFTVNQTVIEHLTNKNQYAVDYRMRKQDGTYIWVHDVGQKTIAENGENVIISVCYDITELKDKQTQMDNLIQNVSCGLVVSKSSTADVTYEIQYMNEGFCKLFESTEEILRECFKTDLYAGVFSDDFEKVDQMIAQLLDNKKHTSGTLRFVLPNGKMKWIRIEINAVLLPDGMATTYATYYDVTTQVQQEQQLRDVIHNVPGGICLYRWDGKKLDPIIVSEQFSALLGVDGKMQLEQTKGMDYSHTHPDDLPGLQKAIRNTFEKCGKLEYTYRSFHSQKKEWLWIYLQAIAVLQPDGTQLAYVSYTDITKEHLMSQSLRASERALDTATEKAGLWYWNYDPSTKRAYFNPRCMRDFDLPEILENYPQAWLDKNFILPEYTSLYADSVKRVQAGEAQVVFEAQVRFQDGIVHWAEFRFTNLLDENGKPEIVVCTGRLIDNEKALLAKYEMEQQKPSLGEKDLLIHAIFNLDTGKTIDYDFTGGAQHLEEKYKTLEDATANVAQLIIGSEAREKFLEINDPQFLKEQLKQGNTSFSVDYRRRMQDGRIIWVRNISHLIYEPNTKEIMLFEYCYDIHEQKMVEEVLCSATIYDYECVASINFAIGKMMSYGYWGDTTSKELLDYDEKRREYAKKTVTPEEEKQFLADSEPETVMKRVENENTYDFTTKIRRPDGTIGVTKTRFVPYDIKNNIYIMTRTDVTNLLKEEEEKNSRLREMLAVAQQANSAKSDFLSSMSHDIRTPMNAIVGMCALAIEDEDNKKQVHESLETIHSSSQLLLSLINNILDMSRIESGKMVLSNAPFSLTEQVNETATSYKTLAKQKNQQFQLHLNIMHDNCSGDIARIHSAIDNILSNAIKYTPNGGTITYRVSEVASDKAGIGLYRFEISDTGIGISKEKQKHLFEPFYRGEMELTDNIEGTGLGLSITKAIVDLKGGTISVNSSKGIGTTFVVELPLHFASTDHFSTQKLEHDKHTNKYDLSNIHILVCEDHPINQKVAQRMLEKAHAKVTIAENGQIGYETFVQSANGTFDMILMDIQMPKMNGYAATKAIRESSHPQAKAIPIVAMTANAFSEDVQKSLNAGMNEHLAKPIVPSQLCEIILRHVNAKTQSDSVKVKVLFVDDVEINIAVLTAEISDEYEIFVARSGAEALNTLEQNPDIAAVITDIMMPEMDGITVIKTIRANNRYQNVAIIANTQYGDARQEEKLLRLGADDFLYKPTTPFLVRSRLKSALRKYDKRLQ